MSRKKDSFRKKRVVGNFSFRGRYFRKEPARSEKIPRNAPCPCGSGKKYKNCCRIRPRSIFGRIKRWVFGGETS